METLARWRARTAISHCASTTRCCSARISYPMYLFASACCWQRSTTACTASCCWSTRDRHHRRAQLPGRLLRLGRGLQLPRPRHPGRRSGGARDGGEFDAFWDSKRSVPVQQPPTSAACCWRAAFRRCRIRFAGTPERVAQLSDDAGNPDWPRAWLGTRWTWARCACSADRRKRAVATQPVGRDRRPARTGRAGEREVLLQTPYLVLSESGADVPRPAARAQPPGGGVDQQPASTDSVHHLRLVHKYKRRYLRDFGFEIHEVKPFPQDAPMREAAGTLLGAEDGAAKRPPATARTSGRTATSAAAGARRRWTREYSGAALRRRA